MDETGEQGVAREVLEETGLIVNRSEFLFSYPNLYKYSGMIIHTLDMFFRCYVDDMSAVHAMDDAAGYEWIPLDAIVVDEFGLDSIRIGLHRWLNR